MNFNFIFGCRPSAGVKGNTDMVQNILLALTQNADRTNAKSLIPQSLEYLRSSDAQFETVSSSRIQTIMLFYRDNIATHLIGIVLYHNSANFRGRYSKDLQDKKAYNSVVPCRQMLK